MRASALPSDKFHATLLAPAHRQINRVDTITYGRVDLISLIQDRVFDIFCCSVAFSSWFWLKHKAAWEAQVRVCTQLLSKTVASPADGSSL